MEEDEWVQNVQTRLLCCIDLVQAEGRYHGECKTLFHLKALTPETVTSTGTKGRKVDVDAECYFEEACSYLENVAEVMSLQELHRKMTELAGSSADKVYSSKWTKEKLKKKYGDHLFFAEINGKPNMICFKDMASYIINEKWYADKEANIHDETERIVTTAAKLILSDLRQCLYDTSTYPTVSEIR